MNASKQPTREQWAEVESQLENVWCPVYMRCDDYLVSACLHQVKHNLLGIVVSINGVIIDPAWMPKQGRPISEEVLRFWRPRKRAVVSRNRLRRLEKSLGKRECRRLGFYDHLVFYDPVWSRPRPLIRHLKKHNSTIILIDFETYEANLAVLLAQQRNEPDPQHALF